MIKKIPIEQLVIGMYIHDLNCSWMDHPFARNRFIVNQAVMLRKIQAAGITEVSIDTRLGRDVQDAETAADGAEAEAEAEGGAEAGRAAAEAGRAAAEAGEPLAELVELSPNILTPLSPAEEFERARALYTNASELMQDMMKDVRLGKQVSLEQCEPMVENIIDSVFRLPSALLPLVQIKNIHEYTYQHSVAVAALSVAFGRVLELPRDEIGELALGGLLHDVGKALVPGRLLSKPGKLEDAEFAVMKTHVVHTARLLKEVKGISNITFLAAAQHHERYDGTGYPDGLLGEQISLHGQMLAIVDVYDAITSIRAYHRGLPPTETLRKMFLWSGSHFNQNLVQAFIKGIGIYPAGSLVRMESDRLGIVREVSPDRLLQPVVQIIYDCRQLCLLKPEMVDLAVSDDKIKSHESFDTWGLPRTKWATAPI